MAVLVRIHHEGRLYVIEAPAGARVVCTSAEDCLVFRWEGRMEYLLTPFAVLCARAGAWGLRLVCEMPEEA
jgi:hypothetical protein